LKPRLLLILTENWTMRPAPDVADLVRFAVEAERAGIDGFTTFCVKPSQFIDETAGIGAFCRELAEKAGALTGS
jgi:hypothetical protein